MSIAIPKLINGGYDFTITSDQGSWLASMLTIGDLLGDIIGFSLINTFGKKKLIFWTTVPLVISWILTTVGPNVIFLFFGKFIAGIADGILFTTVPTFMSEIADPQIRGILGSSYSVTLVLGMLLMNVLLYFLDMKTAGYIAIALNIPLFFTFPFLPDSAYFYLLKKDPVSAKASLQKYFGRGDVENDLSRISKAVEDDLSNYTGFKDIILEKTYRKALLISITITVLNQLTGNTAILSYCTTVFEGSKSFLNPELSNIIFFVVLFIFVALASSFMDNYGRRTLIIISSGGTVVCLLGNAIFVTLKEYSLVSKEIEYVQLIILLLYISFYAIGLYSVPLIVSSEVFTPSLKGIGLCITNISFSLSSTFSLKFLTWTNDAVGMYLPFYIFAFWALLIMLFTIFILPETKGKTLEDIQVLLRVGQKEKQLEIEI